MTVHLSANTEVTSDLLSRYRFTSYSSLSQARVIFAQQVRLTMQYPQTYQTPLDQKLPADLDLDVAAQYVHPWNIAAALANVCVNGPRFGGELLAPQEDLMVYVNEWVPMGTCTFPSALLEMAVEKPQSVAAVPDPTPAKAEPVSQPAPEAATPAQPQLVGMDGGAKEAAAPEPQGAVEPKLVGVPLPDPDITLPRKGQTGRPQKSPFEKKMAERNKVAPPPFWWSHMVVSAPLVFTQSPASALDDSSSGTGPVQSYQLLTGLLLRALKGVDPHVKVAELREYLRGIDEAVSQLECADAANQLRRELLGD